MTEDEIAVKFDALGEEIIGKKACGRLRTLIMSMEKHKNLENFFELMTA